MTIEVQNHGSIWLLQPIDEDAETWLAENIGEDALWLGNALAVEPRYIRNITDGFVDDGGTVKHA